MVVNDKKGAQRIKLAFFLDLLEIMLSCAFKHMFAMLTRGM